MTDLKTTTDLLGELIALPTISSDSNLEMIALLANRLGDLGAEVDIQTDATGTKANLLARIGPGVLWVAALLACLLTLDRLFQADFEDGSLDLLIIGPLPAEMLVLAKVIAHWLTSVLPLIVIAPILGLSLNLPGDSIFALTGALLTGTPTLSLIGAVGAALTVGMRRGGVLLSLQIGRAHV